MKLGYVILYVPDVLSAVDFYERAFGLKRRFVHETQYAEMETGATALAFVDETFVAKTVPDFIPSRPGKSPAAVEVGLVSDDVAATFKQAVAAGAVAVLAPMQKPWGQTISYVRDLNGPWLLYDNAADPYQINNLAGQPAHAKLQGELEERLKKKLAEQRDEFRPGPEYVKKWGYQVDTNETVRFTP